MNNSDEILKELCQKVKENRGTVMEIARSVGITRQAVMAVLKGKFRNNAVIIKASQLVRERESARLDAFSIAKENLESIAI